ncbi:MAG: ATP-binding protein [Deltaproteobacteria bacterium]|nr:ATP-binding protein [Deltaproteobacteria bacterium]
MVSSLIPALVQRLSTPVNHYCGKLFPATALALQSCLPLAQSAHVRLQHRSNGNGECVRIDRQRMQQVFENLIQNAIQYSPPGGTVLTETTDTADSSAWIEYVVADEGPGFQAEDLPRIFEPFFSRRRGGTGLGLAIVQKIITEHGGTITAENRPAGGAAITVRLPVSGGERLL